VPILFIKNTEKLVNANDSIDVNLEKFGELNPIIIILDHLMEILKNFKLSLIDVLEVL
jgi:hypothetical protein